MLKVVCLVRFRLVFHFFSIFCAFRSASSLSFTSVFLFFFDSIFLSLLFFHLFTVFVVRELCSPGGEWAILLQNVLRMNMCVFELFTKVTTRRKRTKSVNNSPMRTTLYRRWCGSWKSNKKYEEKSMFFYFALDERLNVIRINAVSTVTKHKYPVKRNFAEHWFACATRLWKYHRGRVGLKGERKNRRQKNHSTGKMVSKWTERN